MELLNMTSVKSAGLFVVCLLWASSAASLPINPLVTGADMAGMNVTAFYGSGSESAIWGVTSAGPGGPFGEGFTGEASGTGWSLRQQGYTEGNLDLVGSVLGLWTLTNHTGFNITSVRIDALIAGIVFDVIFGSEVTPGSDNGREFTPSPANPVVASAAYTNQFNPSYDDLFGTMTIFFDNSGLADGAAMQFLADTDSVPEPATFLLFAIGLLGMFSSKFRVVNRIGLRSI